MRDFVPGTGPRARQAGAPLRWRFLISADLNVYSDTSPSPGACATAFTSFFKVGFFLLYKNAVIIENGDEKKAHT